MAVFVSLLFAIFVLILVARSGLVTNTVGTWLVAGYGALLGTLGPAPFAIRFMKKSPVYGKMDRPNAYACQGGICATASVLSYCLLLGLNAPSHSAVPFEKEAQVVGWRHPTGIHWIRATLNISNDEFGQREIVVTRDVWRLATTDRQLRIIALPGRLGFPLITGCELNGIAGAQPILP